MNLIPHGHTVLVEPDPAPEQTDSGLILMPQDKYYVATSGTVVAVGKGSKRLWDERKKIYRKAALLVDAKAPLDMGAQTAVSLLRTLERQPEPAPSVRIGDRVVFAAEAGLTVRDDGREYILLEEDRIAIVVEEEGAA